MYDPLTAAGLALVLLFGLASAASFFRGRRKRLLQRGMLEQTQKAGTAPVTLHPVIHRDACICTGACVSACPEKNVLGMVDGRPELLRPAACIGHGACLRACPVDAITLVIGSKERGVDLPIVSPDFQTAVPGLYLAGELGGMGLIHNAVEQGTQALRAIANSLAGQQPPVDGHQVAIVGAGPAGLAAALLAAELGLSYVLLEQGQLGGALRSFPRQKVVMTAPMNLPGYGKVRLRRTTKEALLELWEQVAQKNALHIETGVRITDIDRGPDGVFVLKSEHTSHRAQRVLLAIGRRGSPRKLGVPGEERDTVTYELLEPDQYRGKRCVVFGGGDSAVESALMLSRLPDTDVHLVHRGARFDRVKPDNHDALQQAASEERLHLHTSCRPLSIQADGVELEGKEGHRSVACDYLFVLIGSEPPVKWLSQIGVEIRTFRGEAHPAFV